MDEGVALGDPPRRANPADADCRLLKLDPSQPRPLRRTRQEKGIAALRIALRVCRRAEEHVETLIERTAEQGAEDRRGGIGRCANGHSHPH